MSLFKRKPKPLAYDYIAHMKALLAITEKAIKITEVFRVAKGDKP